MELSSYVDAHALKRHTGVMCRHASPYMHCHAPPIKSQSPPSCAGSCMHMHASGRAQQSPRPSDHRPPPLLSCASSLCSGGAACDCLGCVGCTCAFRTATARRAQSTGALQLWLATAVHHARSRRRRWRGGRVSEPAWCAAGLGRLAVVLSNTAATVAAARHSSSRGQALLEAGCAAADSGDAATHECLPLLPS